jgi:hypothetical protein
MRLIIIEISSSAFPGIILATQTAAGDEERAFEVVLQKLIGG